MDPAILLKEPQPAEASAPQAVLAKVSDPQLVWRSALGRTAPGTSLGRSPNFLGLPTQALVSLLPLGNRSVLGIWESHRQGDSTALAHPVGLARGDFTLHTQAVRRASAIAQPFRTGNRSPGRPAELRHPGCPSFRCKILRSRKIPEQAE